MLGKGEEPETIREANMTRTQSPQHNRVCQTQNWQREKRKQKSIISLCGEESDNNNDKHDTRSKSPRSTRVEPTTRRGKRKQKRISSACSEEPPKQEHKNKTGRKTHTTKHQHVSPFSPQLVRETAKKTQKNKRKEVPFAVKN